MNSDWYKDIVIKDATVRQCLEAILKEAEASGAVRIVELAKQALEFWGKGVII